MKTRGANFDLWFHASPGATEVRDDGVHLWNCDLDDTAGGRAAGESCLSAGERERATRLKNETARRRFVRGRAFVREVLGRLLGVAPRALEIGVGANGKPHLVTPTSPIRFNVSHSGDLLVLVVNYGAEIGVDVELVASGSDLLAMARDHFARPEVRQLEAAAPDARIEFFYRLWTAREAAAKLSGYGIARASAETAAIAPRLEVCHFELELKSGRPHAVGAIARVGRD
ncbi:MAG: 4'-phosphopantetheinyl transferase superfamily protein [Verrucomicrobia bacterium]|nr:4'-phosphopantetheinyl transferase superfamily protein [Verrucomicrobiota bacterium]